jgi:aspartate aminotransferase-like enzyme
MESIFINHAYTAEMTRKGIKNLGLELLPDEFCASNTVTAVRVPDGIDAQRLSSILRTKHHVVVAGGLLQLQGKILRIGHMGIVKETEVEELLAALRSGLSEVGYTVPS